MVATERLGRATGQVEASGQEFAVGRAATLQAVTRVKPEQVSKVKMWRPTRLLTGEGCTNGEETDKHLFGPPGYWARHVGKMIWVIGGDPATIRPAKLQCCCFGMATRTHSSPASLALPTPHASYMKPSRANQRCTKSR